MEPAKKRGLELQWQMLIGFLVGTYGHIARRNSLVITGIILIFLATVLLPLLIFRGGN